MSAPEMPRNPWSMGATERASNVKSLFYAMECASRRVTAAARAGDLDALLDALASEEATARVACTWIRAAKTMPRKETER